MYCSCGKLIKFTSYHKHTESEYHKKHTYSDDIPNLDPMWDSFMDLYKDWLITSYPMEPHFVIDFPTLVDFLKHLLNVEKVDDILKLYEKYKLYPHYITFYRSVAYHIGKKIYNEYNKLYRERLDKKKNELKLLCMNRLINDSYILEPELLKMILKY